MNSCCYSLGRGPSCSLQRGYLRFLLQMDVRSLSFTGRHSVSCAELYTHVRRVLFHLRLSVRGRKRRVLHYYDVSGQLGFHQHWPSVWCVGSKRRGGKRTGRADNHSICTLHGLFNFLQQGPWLACLTLCLCFSCSLGA